MLPPIYSTLTQNATVYAITANRIFRHGYAPQDIATPYITWALIFGDPENTLSEVPQIDRQTLQVDCWHTTDTGIETMAKAVRDALEPYAHMTAILLDEREPDTKLYRISLQFDWWEPR